MMVQRRTFSTSQDCSCQRLFIILQLRKQLSGLAGTGLEQMVLMDDDFPREFCFKLWVERIW